MGVGGMSGPGGDKPIKAKGMMNMQLLEEGEKQISNIL